MAIPTEADVIVIGGGAAGCVVAGRLAAADPTLEIIIVEAGRNNLEDQDIIKPGMCRIHLAPKVAPKATTMKAYIGKPSENLAGRKPIVPVAQILGGGSSVNYMMYTRASASDYDDWGTKGWATNDLLPLLRKCESYSVGNLKSDTHGYSGPLAVSHGGCPVGIADEFLTAAQGRGYSIVDDAQDLKTSNAFARWAKWIDPVTGRRSDAAHGYVHPQMTKNTNLRLLLESTVSKIIIENGLATGIEYVPTIAIEGTTPLSSSIKARKLIVLSAGALSSPGILERSGVGAKKVLAAAGVAPIVDLPGVGMDYQDHTLLISVYKVADNAETCDDLGRLDPDALMKAEKEFLEGKGILATNFVDVGGKLRPTEKELESFDAAFHKHWKDQFQDAEDKPVVFTGMINGFVGNHSLTGLTEGKYISIINMGLYPASHGFVHITSNDPHTDPEFDPGFLSHPADLTPMVWSYKLSRELVRRMPSYRGEVQAFHPQFPAGSTASVKPIDTDDIIVREDIVYNNEDDEAIKRFCRTRVTSTWHGLGTLPMKLRENGGVVDKELSVYGVANLKVADLSICPNNVGSNTYSTALTIGEKCAILCGAYLGISNI